MADSLYERAASAIRGLKNRRSASGEPHIDALASISHTGLNAEKVRLVIWDLDETFWRGTLTEGGIEYIQANHDTVIELANRGIMSSICSRNDHNTIEALLRERGIWDYFIFPDIDWSSKGPRLKRVVEASQLRAPTVLFIDDNPMNRAEALRFVEGIRVADPNNMPNLLDDPLLQGKEDRELTRLSQYKLLERRASDMKVVGDSNAFLRESAIKVIIDHEVESNLDRAIELINRTNQLNFTKSRLPEEQESARRELRMLLNNMEIQAGLVRVIDRYGDYGYCGLYVQHRSLHGARPRLIHFCFSCRTLGMEVETWVYRRLGKPDLEVCGEVLTEVKNSDRVIDWIELESIDSFKGDASQPSPKKIPRIYIRGGCEAVAISHYFEVLTDNLVSEFSFQRNELPVRLDHSQMLRLALDKPAAPVMESLLAIGYRKSDFDTEFLHKSDEAGVYILGLWAEGNYTVFRHTKIGFRALVYLSHSLGAIPEAHLLSLDLESLSGFVRNSWIGNALVELKNNYEYEGRIPSEVTRQNILDAVELLPPRSLVFLIGCTEKTMDNKGILYDFPDHIDLNNSLRFCAAKSERIIFMDIDEHIKQAHDRIGAHNHYSREVYFRLFSNIRTKIYEWASLDGNL